MFKDTITENFHEDALRELVEYLTMEFILDSQNRFIIGIVFPITTVGYHYENAFGSLSRKLHINVNGQRCLFHIM